MPKYFKYILLALVVFNSSIYSMASAVVSSSDTSLNQYLRQNNSYKIIERSGDQKVVQFSVLQQSSDAGGSFSCGYHALKNGIEIAQAILADNGQKDAHLQNLISKDYVLNKFGNKTTPWKLI
ncbi:MAG: hypothetical protein ACYC2U_08885, partial [Candidatus Amoebophilus sp.]